MIVKWEVPVPKEGMTIEGTDCFVNALGILLVVGTQIEILMNINIAKLYVNRYFHENINCNLIILFWDCKINRDDNDER